MKVFVCLLAICVSVAYCDVKKVTDDRHKTYGSTKEYGKEKEYGHDAKDESHGYDGDSHKKAYGSEREYGTESKYGHESHDKSHSHGDYGYGKDKSHDDYGNYGNKRDSHGKDKSHEDHYTKQQTYHGKYTGHCGEDGFYYGDHDNFIICSNSNAYVQPCAPGSRNSGLHSYSYGGDYSYRDFCDVNLVDHGYGLKDTHGYGYHGDRANHAQEQYLDLNDEYERSSYGRDFRLRSYNGPSDRSNGQYS